MVCAGMTMLFTVLSLLHFSFGRPMRLLRAIFKPAPSSRHAHDKPYTPLGLERDGSDVTKAPQRVKPSRSPHCARSRRLLRRRLWAR